MTVATSAADAASTRAAPTSSKGAEGSSSSAKAKAQKGSNVVFTSIYGCDEGATGVGPACSILEVGGVTIMLDCGWDIHFDTALLEPLRSVVKRVDLVLISHPDLEHLGALPYAFGKLGMRARVYATLPVQKMGQMTVYDAYLSRTHEGNFDAFNLDDVDAAFARFKTLKFSQHLTFSGRGAGVTVTPYAAGRMIGSAVWRVSWQTEDNDIVYATAFNLSSERHLRATTLSALTRPNVLITDAHNVLTEARSRKWREERLISTVMDTVRGGGNVLLPTDTAGRVLELLVLLDDHWQKHRLGSYKLVLLHNTAFNTAEFAKSQLEWMSEDIGRAFDLQRSNPFELRNVHIIHSLEELDELRDDPMVVLAADMSLDFGFSKALLLRWASGKSNTILLTGRGHGNTTARSLLAQLEVRERAKEEKATRKMNAMEDEEEDDEDVQPPLLVHVKVPVRVPLAGEELRAFRDEENRKRRLEAEEEEQRRQAAAMEKEQVIADSDDEGEGGGAVASTAEPTQKKRRAIVASLFSKYSKPQHLMFGYHDPHVPMDEYGVKETEPIGWLAAAMQQQNSEMPAAMEEEGAARGKLKVKDGKFVIDKSDSQIKERENAGGKTTAMDDTDGKEEERREGKEGEQGEEQDGHGGEEENEEEEDEDEDEDEDRDNKKSTQGPVDPLRMGAAGGKESAFFQDSGAVPTKLVNEDQEVEVQCRVVYVDSEGLSVGRNVRGAVEKLAPKMLVVVGGTRRATSALVQHFKNNLEAHDSQEKKKASAASAAASGERAAGLLVGGAAGEVNVEPRRFVVVRKALEPVPVGLDSGAIDVLLHDSLHTQLKWKQLKNYGVAHMECRVDYRVRPGGPPLLCAKPRGERMGHPAMFLSVGKVNLMQHKTALEAAGIKVLSVVYGTLRCEGAVTVRCGDQGETFLEGPMGDAYYRVRNIVYNQYTII